jgi:hypothetical protein
VEFKPVKPLADLIMKHAGQRICVMGGSKSLDTDLETIDADVYISVNDHGARRREVDYIVCMDNIHTAKKVEMRHYLREFSDAPVVSPWHWGEYQICRWPDYPYLFNSGVIASWVAYLMGAHPLIFAGFDCYGGQPRIIDMHKTFVKHVKAECRVASGPLLQLYPQHDATEALPEFKVPEIFGEAMQGQIQVLVKAPFEYRGYSWPVGTKLTVSEYEVRRQIKHKSLERVS